MNQFSKRVTRLKPSGTMKVASEVKALKATGIKVYDLGAGDPDFAPPAVAVEAAVTALKQGKTHYPHGWGEPDLRKEIVKKYQRQYGLVYDPDAQVLITPGGKKAVSLAVTSIVDQGDGVLIPKPYWTSYPEMVELYDGIPVFFDLAEGFEQLDQLVADNRYIKAIILNSPSNPTGAVLSLEQIKVLVEIVNKWDLWVISDEIYEQLVFPGVQHHCLANFFRPEKTIIANGFSKTYAMTGLRLGYALGSSQAIKHMANVLGQDTGPSCSISQAAAYAAMTELSAEEEVKLMAAKYYQRYKEIIEPFAKRCGLNYFPVQGAFYIFFQLPKKFGNDCSRFCSELLKKEQVALVPGTAFGYDGWVRLCFAAPDEDLRIAVDKIQNFLA